MGKFMIFPFHFTDIYDIIMGGEFPLASPFGRGGKNL
jgi:hypothetical protein